MKQVMKSKIAFSVVAAAAVVTLGSSVFSGAFAATGTCAGTSPEECTVTGVVEVAVDETLTIVLSTDTVLIEASAAQNTGFAQGDTQVTVGTNSANGASLYAEMDSTMTSNALIGSSVPSNTIAATTPGANLTNNSWGYKAYDSALSAPSTWSAMNVYGTPALIFDNNTNGGGAGMSTVGSTTWTFEYGVQIDYTLPADTYSGTVLYTATTN